MDEIGNNGSKKHKIMKGVLYTGLAGIAAAGIYLFSKYRHLNGRTTYTIAGVALLVATPGIIDIAKTCVDNRAEIRKIEIYSSVKKDSIDAILRLNAPKDTKTLDITDLFNKSLETSKAIENKYQAIVSDNSKKYEELIAKKDEQYNTTVNVLRENTAKLQNSIEELKHVQANTVPVNNASNEVSRRRDASGNTNNNNLVAKVSETPVLSYYLIDADKSDGEIRVYAVRNDGSRKPLSISSRASFASNGGPADGNYTLRNKGVRYGDLYPGFLEMNDPVGISGAGDQNQYLDDIQEGAMANKTGIRVPNEIYSKIARLVDEKKTVISVHD
jgi:hypothetical protein